MNRPSSIKTGKQLRVSNSSQNSTPYGTANIGKKSYQSMSNSKLRRQGTSFISNKKDGEGTVKSNKSMHEEEENKLAMAAKDEKLVASSFDKPRAKMIIRKNRPSKRDSEYGNEKFIPLTQVV